MRITLCGFGDFEEMEDELKELQEVAKAHGVECYATYYDHELKGERDAVERVTVAMWSMPRDEWGENALYETIID